MYEYYYGNNFNYASSVLIANNIFYHNAFSGMTEGEKRAVLDGAAGKEKQRRLLDYITGVYPSAGINLFFDI